MAISPTRKRNALCGAIGAIMLLGGLVLGYARAFLFDWEFQVDYHQAKYEVFSAEIFFDYNFTIPIQSEFPYQIVIKWDCCSDGGHVGYDIFLNDTPYASWFEDATVITTVDEYGDESMTYCDFGIFEIYPVVVLENSNLTVITNPDMGGELHVYQNPPPRERHPGLWVALNIIFPIIGILVALGGVLLGARSLGWCFLTFILTLVIMIAIGITA